MSFFFNPTNKWEFKIPLEVFDCVWEDLSNIEDSDNFEEQVHNLYRYHCKKLTNTSSKKYLNYFISRIVSATEKAVEQAGVSNNASRSSKKVFGHDYFQFIGSQDISTLVLIMCNFDYERAHKVYAEYDRDEALHMVTVYTEHNMLTKDLLIQATVIGSGGEFKTESKEQQLDPNQTIEERVSSFNNLFK